MADAQRTLEALKARPLRMVSGWDMAHVLHHVAQSVEYSVTGFPLLKPAWFRATVGPAAYAVFEARGRMTHGLDEPIPGATPITDGQPPAPAVEHLVAALAAFERHTGPLSAARNLPRNTIDNAFTGKRNPRRARTQTP